MVEQSCCRGARGDVDQAPIHGSLLVLAATAVEGTEQPGRGARGDVDQAPIHGSLLAIATAAEGHP